VRLGWCWEGGGCGGGGGGIIRCPRHVVAAVVCARSPCATSACLTPAACHPRHPHTPHRYFLRGSLPWQGLQAATKKQKYEKISEKKMKTSFESLCKGFPTEFVTYFQYVRSARARVCGGGGGSVRLDRGKAQQHERSHSHAAAAADAAVHSLPPPCTPHTRPAAPCQVAAL
jgi:hypothetical protein